MTTFTDSAGEFYGSCLSVIPPIDNSTTPRILITAESAQVTDYADPTRPTRANAGFTSVQNGKNRYTSIPSGIGRVAWEIAAIDQENELVGPPEDPNDVLDYIDIIGPSADAKISSAIGLGRFASSVDYSKYVDGDFDGDNVSDYAITSPDYNVNGTLYIVHNQPISGRRIALLDLADFNKGLPPGANPTLQVPILGTQINGTAAIPLKEGVQRAGNFNGDTTLDSDNNTLADLLVTISTDNNSTGKIVVIFGQKNLRSDETPFDMDDVGSDNVTTIKGLTIVGEADGDKFGTVVCSINDVNGDGVDDVLVSAPGADDPDNTSITDCGKVYLIYGKRDMVKPIRNKFGIIINWYVDYDGDGDPDGTWNVGDLIDKGLAVAFIGEEKDFAIERISSAGDVNGDELNDFLIGSPKAEVQPSQSAPTMLDEAGRAYLILGREYIVP
jgi:hypothetical protein